MLFVDYLDRVYDTCIVNVEEAWSSYLNPNYRYLLKKIELEPSVVEDYDLSWEELAEILKLEVERRLVVTGRGRALGEWLYEIINDTIDPALETGRTEIVNAMLELMKQRNEPTSTETSEGKKKKQKNDMLKLINFSKKDAKDPKTIDSKNAN